MFTRAARVSVGTHTTMLVTGFLAVSLLALTRATPVKRAMVTHEHLSASPDGFTRSGAAAPTTPITFRLALTNNDIAGLERALYAVSTPGSASYGQHLSKEQVEAFERPTPETTAAVTEWLTENGVTAKTISDAGDWMEFTIPVSQANALLSASFSVFTHAETGTTGIRTLAYSVPATLQSAIAVIHPTTSFWNPFNPAPKFTIAKPPTTRQRLTRQSIPTSCETIITPDCLQALYGIPNSTASQSSNGLAVSGFIQQFASQADLSQFLGVNRPDIPNATFALQTLDGGTNPQTATSAGIEANLDIQYTVGVATGVPVTFVSVGPNNVDGLNGFIDIINFFLNETTPPTVLTTSYGQNENTVSKALATTLCNKYMSLGARGTSILFASGDGGVAGSQPTNCRTFLPTFPSGCPFMTSVGATTGIPETAASFSSGGFSNDFAQPSYQATAVATYLAGIGKLNSGKFNTTGRGFPDVSAMGDNVLITWQTETGTVAGTSCSSPIFASIIALINDQLIASGAPPLGFLNPFLYTNAAAFTDITTGNNPGCGTNGFPAAVGWDPITGIGTPNFAQLLAAAGL